MGFVDVAWGIALTVWALVAGTAVARVAMGPSEFGGARFLFWASAVPLIVVDITWVFMTDKPIWERLLISGIVGAVALISVTEGLRWVNHREANTEQPLIAKQQAKTKSPDGQGRIFVGESITPEYLIGIFREHTDIQGANLTAAYIGKWMRVTGPVGNVISTTPALAQLTFVRPEVALADRTWADYIDFYMIFRGPWIDRLAILKRGEKLTVIGQIERIDRVSVQLTNCELAVTD